MSDYYHDDESEAIMWFWKTDGNSWDAYSDVHKTELERALKAGERTIVLYDSVSGTPKYECHLAKVPMYQENLQTNYRREIYRGDPRTLPPQAVAGAVGDDDDDDYEEGGDESNPSTDEDNSTNDTISDNVEKLIEQIEKDPDDMTNAAPPSFICSLSRGIMRDPVITLVGSTYEKIMIEEWLRVKRTDPLTNQHLPDARLIENRALNDSIQFWRNEYYEKKEQQQQEEQLTKPNHKTGNKEEDYNLTSTSVLDTDVGHDMKVSSSSPVILSDQNNSLTTASSAAPSKTNVVVAHSVGGDLKEGEERQVSSYTVKLRHGVFSCSCPAWRYQSAGIDRRTCKHLKQVRGVAKETERVRTDDVAASKSSGSTKRKRRESQSLSLEGRSICFTGALTTMKRAEAHAMSQKCGAKVHMNVTRNTDILVIGKRPGIKLSLGDEAKNCELWEEDDFVAATENTLGSTSSSSNNSNNSNNSDQNPSIPARIMLAHSYKVDDNNSSRNVDPTGWLMSEKLDGMRAFWDGNTRRLWSRQGKAVHAPRWWSEGLPSNILLDGELWLGRGRFQECMSIVRRQDEPQTWEKITFVVFDIPDNDSGALQSSSQVGYEERFKRAKEAIRKASSGTSLSRCFAKLHPFEICQGPDHVKSALTHMEQSGGEGLILRRPGSLYKGGRSQDLLKVKRARDDEAVVRSHVTGSGRHAGRLGAVRVVNRSGKSFKIGSGFTDAERENPPPVGTVVTYRYNELTDGGIPRFPVFVRIRPDVDPGDIVGSSAT